MPGIQHLQITLERHGQKPLRLGHWFFVEFRDAFTRRGCRCVRHMAVVLPDGRWEGRLCLEVFPYGSLGVGGLHFREGENILPVAFKVVRTRGDVRRAEHLFSRPDNYCEIGDHDPVAQTNDLKRRALRHCVLVETMV